MQLLQADRVAEPHTSKLEKNEQGFNDVASLIGSLIADLAKESQEPKVEEDHSQGDYAAFMSESSESRVEKVNEVEELQNTKSVLVCEFDQIEGGACVRSVQPRWAGQDDQTQLLAINRFNKFYAPMLHKVASKAELRADDHTYVMGGEITIAAPTGNTSTNVARVQLLQVAPAAEPFTPWVFGR